MLAAFSLIFCGRTSYESNLEVNPMFSPQYCLNIKSHGRAGKSVGKYMYRRERRMSRRGCRTIGEAVGLYERLKDYRRGYRRGCRTIGEAVGLYERLKDYRRGC